MLNKRKIQDGPFEIKKVTSENLDKKSMTPLSYVDLSGISDSKKVQMENMKNYIDLQREITSKKNKKLYDVIDLRDIDKTIGEIANIKKEYGAENSSKIKFYEGDILFGKLRPYLNQVTYVNKFPSENDYFIGSSEWYRLIPKNKLLGYYMFFVLRTRFTLYQTSASHGSVRPRFNPSKNTINIPILKSKKLMLKINNIVKKIFQIRKTNKEKLNKLINLYDNLADIKVSNDTLLNKVSKTQINSARMDYNYYILNEINKEIERKNHNYLGNIAKFSELRIHEKYNSDDEINYITINDVNEYLGEIVNWKKKIYKPSNRVKNKAPNRAKMIVKENDILLPYLKLSLNSIAWVPFELKGSICTNGFAVLRAPKYYGFLYTALRSNTVQSQLELLAAGTIMEDITADHFKKLKIFIPEKNNKKEISNKASRILNKLWIARKCYIDIISSFENFCLNEIDEISFKKRIKQINKELE